MLSAQELQQVLPTLPRTVVHGLWTRALAFQYAVIPPPGSPLGTSPDPLWPGGARDRGARFTPKGSFDSIYLASDPITALMEVSLVLQNPNAPAFTMATPPWVVFAVEGIVTEIVDLCDNAIQSSLNTSLQELTGEWAYSQSIYLNRQGPLPPTQMLGQAAYDCGTITGLKYPSAKQPQSTCLLVFPDRLIGGSQNYLEVHDPSQVLSGRLP
jgi:RES domain-containing protein